MAIITTSHVCFQSSNICCTKCSNAFRGSPARESWMTPSLNTPGHRKKPILLGQSSKSGRNLIFRVERIKQAFHNRTKEEYENSNTNSMSSSENPYVGCRGLSLKDRVRFFRTTNAVMSSVIAKRLHMSRTVNVCGREADSTEVVPLYAVECLSGIARIRSPPASYHSRTSTTDQLRWSWGNCASYV
jgi:hypothetical protein